MPLRFACLLLICLTAAGRAQNASTTRASGIGALEIRAMAAFNQGDYAKAMPLLIKVSQAIKDNPDHLEAIQERIRVCQRNLAKSPPADVVPPAGPPAIKTALEERKVHVPPKDGQVLDLPIKELGNFDYDAEKGGNIPQDIRSLNGAPIRTYGYMIPLDQADHITEFALVPSLFACCFGQPPTVQHTLVVHCPKGKGVRYYPEELVVEGKLKIEEKKDEGLIVSLFEVDCTSVKPAPK